MTGALRGWILGLTGAALLTAVALTITPEGRVRKVVSLVCAAAVMIMMIKPAVGFDYGAYARSLSGLRAEAGVFSEQLQETNEKLTGLIIEQTCSAYILDKGAELGIQDLTVTVTARWSEEGYWYPGAAKLTTDADAGLKSKLGYIIEAELGIAPEELIWSMNHEG